VREYKDTTTLNPGVLGNDLPMTTVRQYRFCAELGFNLSSVVELLHLSDYRDPSTSLDLSFVSFAR
jgi:hypothetical protein